MTQPYSTLFFGMPLTAEFHAAVDPSKNHLYQLYLKDDYLTEINILGTTYIGKPSEELIDLTELKSMQEHIYSLLKNIAPSYPFKEQPLQLIPIRK